MKLVIYRCYDDQEEEACFAVKTVEEVMAFLDKKPGPPQGFEHRDGFYFFEDVSDEGYY